MVSMKETKTQYRGYIMTSKPILYIVIPCYNEEKVLPETEPLFLQTLRGMISEGKIAEESRVMFVNDGSKDATWEFHAFIILPLHFRSKCKGASAGRSAGPRIVSQA